jgi:hypothetical protein
MGLALLCLLPRAITAVTLTAACNDGYFYLYIADALERADFRVALHYLNVNIYPSTLVLVHKLGIDWAVAAKLWGVTVSTLLLFPLFGWIRRHFDDRTALAACFLYAVHPELIELSVEPIRESTFWFLLTLYMYLLSRAVTEFKWWLFGLTGLALGSAIHTRSEGWILLVALFVWTGFQFRNVRSERRRLAFGTLLCLAMTPCLLIVMNVTFLRDHDQWEWGRLDHFQTGYRWLTDESSSGDAAVPPPTAPPTAGHIAAGTPHPTTTAPSPVNQQLAASASQETSQAGPLWTYIEYMIESLEPINALLLLTGGLLWWRMALCRDKSVLMLMSVSILVGVWIQLVQIGSMNGRYFLTIFFFAVPYEALALLLICARLERSLRRLNFVKRWSLAPAALALLSLLALFWTDALSSRHPRRDEHAALGRWLHSEVGPFRLAMVTPAANRVGYFAQNGVPAVDSGYHKLDKLLDTRQPELAILDLGTSLHSVLWRRAILMYLSQRGFVQLDISRAPQTADQFLVLRKKPLERLAHDRSPDEASVRRQ